MAAYSITSIAAASPEEDEEDEETCDDRNYDVGISEGTMNILTRMPVNIQTMKLANKGIAATQSHSMAKAAVSGIVDGGFAKLQGKDFAYYMQTYSIILGRNSKKSVVDVDLVSLGGGMYISREHARIFYDFERRHFALDVIGKNGCLVQGIVHLPGKPPLKLHSQDLIQIGNLQFYFLLPTKSIFASAAARINHPDPVVHPFAVETEQVQQLSNANGKGKEKEKLADARKTVTRHLHEEVEENGNYSVATGLTGKPGSSRLLVQTDQVRELGNENRKETEREELADASIGARKTESRHVQEMEFGNYGVATGLTGKPESSGLLDSIQREADHCHQQLEVEETDVIQAVTNILRDYCDEYRPGEWMLMSKLHSELVERYGNQWHHSRVTKYLACDKNLGRPWLGLLTCIKKYPECFAVCTVSTDKGTTEFVCLA